MKLWQSVQQLAFVANYRRMYPYVRPYWIRALLSVLICIPIGSLDAVIALSLKPYMDAVMIEKAAQSSWYIPFVVVLFTVVQGVLNYFATYLNTWVGGRITNGLKMDLYTKALTLDTAYFDRCNSGDIMMRFSNDADSACAGLLNNLKTFVSRFFSSLSLVGVLFYNSWQLALIAIVVLMSAFLPLAKIRDQIKHVIDKSVVASSVVLTAYNETYAGNKIISSYNLAAHQKQNFREILRNIVNLQIKMVQHTSWLSPLMHVIVSIGIAITIGYGSHLILVGTITSGNFVSFIAALIMLYNPIKNLGSNYNAVQVSFMSIERVFDILNLQPKIHDRPGAKELTADIQKIEFDKVDFAYTDIPVLKQISFCADAGETIALVGNSGGGKSTIVNLIPRFYDVNSGAVKINGIDVRDYTLESLRQQIAIVFQDNFLFSGTIRDNVLLGRLDASEEELWDALKMAYLDDFVKDLPKGIDTPIGERGILLSGGQKQRVAIARAFLKNAPIVILDEATSALDNKAEAIVQRALENLMAERTVFVIAHRLSTIKKANRIIVINAGQIVECGTEQELLAKDGAYAALYQAQFRTTV